MEQLEAAIFISDMVEFRPMDIKHGMLKNTIQNNEKIIVFLH
jgi:hypothetical protein